MRVSKLRACPHLELRERGELRKLFSRQGHMKRGSILRESGDALCANEGDDVAALQARPSL